MVASESMSNFQVKIVQSQSQKLSKKLISDILGIKLKPNSPDVKIIESEKLIGIDTSREIKSFFITTPLHLDFKVVAIANADTLTIPAQQALLKILEEPPSFGYILLHTSNPYRLLGTIRSRCQIVFDTSVSKAKETNFQLPNQNQKLGDRLNLASSYSVKDKAQNHLDELIFFYRNQLLNQPNKAGLFNLTLVLFVQKMLKHNVSTQLAIDYLYLHLR